MQHLDRPQQLLHLLARFASAVVVLSGLLVIIGWVIDNPLLRGRFSPSGITVKTNAGIALLCCGLSLGLQCFNASPRTLRVARFLAVIALVIGALTFAEHLFGWNLQIDQLLFKEPPGASATVSPNRMGPPATLMFIFSGLALLFLQNSGARRAPRFDFSTPLAAVVLFMGIIPSLGFLYGAAPLYDIAKYTGISLFTAITFIILSIGIVVALPFSPTVLLITAPTAGGLLVRRMLPAMLLPPILGYLRTFGEDAGWYEAAMGRALINTAFMVVLAILIWSAGRALNASDRARRSLLEAERAARGEAERASRLKDEFLATLSHELRTPITAILGWSQLLARGNASPDDVSEGIDTIARNARTQAKIIDDLLDMSRIISGKIRLELQPLDLASIVHAAVVSVAPMAATRKVSITTAIHVDPAPVVGDPARLHQILWNLLSNAVKFTPADGLVQVDLQRDGSQIQLRVIDNGQGIKADFLPHLFERFRQQDGTSTRRHGGLGLGLSIVKQLVDFHGGTVTAASEGEDKGSTFTVRLPFRAAETAASGPSFRTGPSAEQLNLSGLRVLVVDDEPDARAIVSRLLEESFADVITADSADAAMTALRQQRPHILVSDISMPHKDGYDLIRTIRDLPAEEGGQTPALALTAFARSEDQEQTRSAGYQLHMAKPVEPRQLITAIANLARKSDAADSD